MSNEGSAVCRRRARHSIRGLGRKAEGDRGERVGTLSAGSWKVAVTARVAASTANTAPAHTHIPTTKAHTHIRKQIQTRCDPHVRRVYMGSGREGLGPDAGSAAFFLEPTKTMPEGAWKSTPIGLGTGTLPTYLTHDRTRGRRQDREQGGGGWGGSQRGGHEGS